jgi:hypothetical protein
VSLAPFSLDDLINAMAANYASAAGLPANVGTGSQLGPIFRSVALAQLLLQNENLYIQSISRLGAIQDPLPDGTANPDVDSFINAFGFYRNGPDAASGYCTFTIPSPVGVDTVVPVGLVVGTVGGPQFAVAPNGTGYNAGANGYVIPAGQTSVSALVQCTATGSVGNVLANTITQVIIGPGDTPPAAPFSVNNPSAFTNGIDAEVGSELKNRFALYISGGGEGTPNSILAAAEAVQSGLTISYGDQVEGVYGSGHWTFTPSTLGWFTIVADVAGAPGTITQAQLDAINAALLNAVRPAGISYAVAGATPLDVAGAGTVVVQPGYDPTAVSNAVNAAFVAFVNGIGLDQYGNATICSIMAVYVALAAVPGVLRIDNLTLNSGTADVQAPFGQILAAGTASFGP